MKLNKIHIFYLMIIIFIAGIVYCLHNIFCVKYDDNTIKTIYASLIIGSISSIGLFINIINNIESRNQTEKLIQENINNRFIQLRFNSCKRAVHDLTIFLQSSINIYYRIIDLYGYERTKRSHNLSPKAFLVMQFVNIITDTLLLNDLPYSLRKFIEDKFENNIKPDFDDSSREMLEIIGNEYHSSSSALDLDEYKEFIHKFIETGSTSQNAIVFKYYYESSNITEEELLYHFNNILNILTSHTIEELILMDENIKIERKDYLTEYNLNMDKIYDDKK